MFGQLLQMISDPARAKRRMLLRASLLVAGIGLLWTVLLAGLGCALLSLDVWLSPRLGPAAALAMTGATGLLAALCGLLVARRRRAPTSACPQLNLDLLQTYPLESVALATAAGILLSGVDGSTLVRALVDQLGARSRERGT